MLAQGSRSECSSEQDRNCMTFCKPASEARSHHCCLLLVEAITNPPRFTGGGISLCFLMKGDFSGGSVKNPPAMQEVQETQVQSLYFAWMSQQTEEIVGVQSTRKQRVGHD